MGKVDLWLLERDERCKAIMVGMKCRERREGFTRWVLETRNPIRGGWDGLYDYDD